MSLARFALDLGKTAARHPWWFGRETLQRLTDVRAKGRARFKHGLPQVYHHLLDPRLERLPVEVGGATWTDYPKAMIVARFCRLLRPETVLEIGTFRGGMTYHIARNTPDNCRIWTLDLPPGTLDAQMAKAMVDTDVNMAVMDRSQVGEQWQGTPEAGKISQLWGDSFHADFSALGPIGLIYIDGSHAEQWVAKDTENAFRFLGPTGAILWDDCYWADVLGVLGHYRKQHPIFMFEDGQTAGYVRIDGKPLVPKG
jgi:hypothetical protein